MKVFIAISPGFYKTKLLNELAKREEILVIYNNSYDKSSRNSDFLKGERNFHYLNNEGSMSKRALITLKQLIFTSYDEVIIGGYDNLFCWLPLFVSKKSKCSLIVETTFRETVSIGLRAFLKKLFVGRLGRVYAPGTPHAKLVQRFGFKGEIRYWNSVGLFNVVPQPTYQERKQVKNFLFVGRLIPVKNLPWLIEIFSKHPELNLTIIGFGEQAEYLKSLVRTDNITFPGAVNNTDLPRYYQEADVFVLPSVSETWGLVVEEALNNGTPVMCSHMVGSADDLIIARNNGVVFNMGDVADFEDKLKEICDINNYNRIRKIVSTMDFEKYEQSVVDAFVN